MQLVIDVPEKVRIEITRVGLLRISDEMKKEVDKAIQSGKPIPKGHGDIVDMNALIDAFWDGNYMEIYKSDLPMIKPIIKADAEDREDNLERD